MFCSLALTVLMATPAQGGALKLTNGRMTIGELGPTRPSNKLLPGDILFVGFDINGLTIEPDGRTKYKVGLEITNSKGEQKLKDPLRERDEYLFLRGNVSPGQAYVTLGLDEEPGIYSCKITVEDPKTKSSDTLTLKYEVLKRDFGIVAVRTSYDYLGKLPAPTTGVVGQAIFIQFSVATFERDLKTKQPNVEIEFQILDEKGTPILGKPVLHTQDDKAILPVKENDGAFPMVFYMFLSRTGKFTAQITATDKVAKDKKITYQLPITVLSAN